MEKRILIIDDDEEMCEEVSEILYDEGFNVTIAFDGISGNQLLNEVKYDIVLLDLKIPGMNGFEILQRIRNDGINVKVIILSGRPVLHSIPEHASPEEQREEEILKKADAFINKPFDIETVIKQIRKLLTI